MRGREGGSEDQRGGVSSMEELYGAGAAHRLEVDCRKGAVIGEGVVALADVDGAVGVGGVVPLAENISFE